MHNVAAELGSQLCDALPKFHTLTGCNFNSSMFRSKKQAFKRLCRSDLHQTTMSQLGKDSTLSEDTMSACEAIVCNLFTKNEMAGSKQKKLGTGYPVRRIRGSRDYLHQYINQDNFQSIIWRKALGVRQKLPKPEDNGWRM